MTEILPITDNTIMWNESNILEQGKSFVTQKNNELKVFQAFWDASVGTDYYNPNAKTTAKAFKAIAETSRNEIKDLNDSVLTCLNQEIAKNPESDKTQQLLKIYSVTDSALNYFTAVTKDSYYPTFFNQSIRDLSNVTAKAAFATTIVSGGAHAVKELTGFQLPETAHLPCKIAVTAFIASAALRLINHFLRIEKNELKICEMKNLFEKTLNPQASLT